MSLSFHWIPARCGQAAQEGLNQALRTLRVVSVEKHFCATGSEPGWAVCVEHVEAVAAASPPRGVPGKAIDYREVLDAATFHVFAALRKLRKDLATEESVPIYTIMTNEQLAAVARRRCQTMADLRAVDGVGEARVRKYGPRFLETLRQASAEWKAAAASADSAIAKATE